MIAASGETGRFGGLTLMTADIARQADGRFLHGILIVLIFAALASGAVAAVSIAKSEGAGQARIVFQP